MRSLFFHQLFFYNRSTNVYNVRAMNIKRRFEEYKEKRTNWLYDHMWAKRGIDIFVSLVLCTLSALIFAFGFNCFMDLGSFGSTNSTDALNFQKIASGGMSGVSQVVVSFCEVIYEAIHGKGTSASVFPESLLYSILYFALNAPMCLLAWFGIGKRFTIFTLINVVETSLFIKLLSIEDIAVMQEIAKFITQNGGLLSRALVGGVCTGLSCAICFKIDASTGGIDIISYYIALKKKTLVGKYSFILNSITIVSFTLLAITKEGWNEPSFVASYVGGALYSVLYVLISKIIIDSINIRNKKVKVEIVSSRRDLGEFLIESLPHGATMVVGEGVYTGKERYIFTMVVSSYELSQLMKLIKKEDDSAFVQVVPLSAVSGRFYTKPIR